MTTEPVQPGRGDTYKDASTGISYEFEGRWAEADMSLAADQLAYALAQLLGSKEKWKWTHSIDVVVDKEHWEMAKKTLNHYGYGHLLVAEEEENNG